MAAFEVDRRDLAERGVPPARVVEALDEVEDGHLRLGLRLEAFAVEKLALERREEALAERVVVRVADRAHRGSDTGLPAAQPERDRRVLRALVRVMDHSLGPALPDGHVQRVEDELRAQVRRHGPADHSAAPRIEHDGQVEEPCGSRDIRDVGDPELVGSVGREVPFDGYCQLKPGPARLRG